MLNYSNSAAAAAAARRGRFLSMSSLMIFLLALIGTAGPTDAANYYGDSNNSNGAESTDDFVDLSSQDFDKVSIMPISCINYMNGHMIKFEMYENKSNFQCHANNLGTFVVSISHYMRAYFNYQALIQGEGFKLPSDAGYLNCVMLQQTAYSDTKLYAKIGCLERDTYTSTKLRLHVYTDKQCSVPYDDGLSNEKGYDINGYYFNSKVSFRPPFYSCATCKPTEISSSFSKRKTFWYDDDAAEKGYQIYKYFDDWLDDYFLQDDAYFTVQKYVNNERLYNKDDDDSFYTISEDDDFYRHRKLAALPEGENEPQDNAMAVVESNKESRHLMGSAMKKFQAEDGALELFEKEFWEEHAEIRKLGNANTNSYYDGSVQSWNMCNKLFKYGVWCDADCRSIDAFRIDQWSKSDLFLLIVMCVFMAFMMLLVFAKRVKAYEKASIYGEEALSEVGMSPSVMACLFVVVFVTVIVLAVLKFVNETLVFSVVTCILLFIFMLKLTLFESKTSPLLGSKKKSKKDPYGYGDDFRYNGDTDNPLFKY